MTGPKVLVASTVAAHACDGVTEFRWLTHLESWRERGYEFFLALQTGQGHDSRLTWLHAALAEFGTGISRSATVWKFSLDQGEPEVTSRNRWTPICMGRNLAHQFAGDHDYTHLCFIDTDIMPTEDGIERLLEIDHPIVGAHVPAYCHDGPKLKVLPSSDPIQTHHFEVGWEACDVFTPGATEPVHFDADRVRMSNGMFWRWAAPPFPADADVRMHWTTAGALMMNRDCFRAVRWRSDPDAGLSDDPATIFSAEQMGYGPEFVRHDVVWDHEPLIVLEDRGRDLTVRR
jgi:hypothetical protein